MADKWPLANGNWSNAANWNGGTKPVAGDDVYADGRSVVIDESVTVATIRNTQRSGGTAGGSFTPNNGITITADVYAHNSTCINMSAGQIVNFIGIAYGGSNNTGWGFNVSASGTTLNVIGNIVGGSVNGGSGVNVLTNGNLNVVGNCIGGTVGAGVQVGGIGGSVTITGNCIGGASGTAAGLLNNVLMTIDVIGNSIAGIGGPGISNTSNGTVRCKRIIGNGWGNGSVGLNNFAGAVNAQTGIIEAEEIEYGDLGNSPTSGPIQFKDVTSNKCIVYRPSMSKKTLVDPSTVGDYPTNANVRLGTQFNFGNNTGTLAVPNPNQVAVGVATDNTVGTAVITAASLRSELGLASANLDTQLAAKPSLSQIEASTILAKEATVGSKASQTSVDALPTLTEIEASSVLAKSSQITSLQNNAPAEAF